MAASPSTATATHVGSRLRNWLSEALLEAAKVFPDGGHHAGYILTSSMRLRAYALRMISVHVADKPQPFRESSEEFMPAVTSPLLRYLLADVSYFGTGQIIRNQEELPWVLALFPETIFFLQNLNS